jgi:hypothetical protein
MKYSRLFIAALALMGIAACAKMEVPEEPEAQEVVVSEDPVASEPEQTPDVKSVAGTINACALIEEVKLFIQSIIVDVNKAEEPWHIEFSIAPAESEEPEFSYISGTLGLTKGVLHPVVLDLDLMIMGSIPIVGKLDMAQVANNFTRARVLIDTPLGAITSQYYLDKATEGLDFTIMEAFKLCFLLDEDETGKRTIGIYLYDPNDPDIPPIYIPGLFTLFTAQG